MDDLFIAMAPHLAANLLTVIFVFAAVLTLKADKEKRPAETIVVGSFVGVGLFMLYGLYVSL